MDTKICTKCKLSKELEAFYSNVTPLANGKVYTRLACKECLRSVSSAYGKVNRARNLFLQAMWRAKKHKRVVPWLTDEHLKQIQDLYQVAGDMSAKAGVNYEVDHIIPLKHPRVSGLHVPWNLHIITDAENIVKMDGFDGTYKNDSWRVKFLKTLDILNKTYNSKK